MKKRILSLMIAAIFVGSSLFFTGCSGNVDSGSLYDDYLEAVDTTYAYDIAVALSETPEFRSSNLGTRTAGSDAEHAAADWLVEKMNEIGLKDVEKAAAKVDKWQFNGASIKAEGDDKEILLHSYATGKTVPEGITAEVVYVGKGTMWDYEDTDVRGKIVLCEVNQRDEWWVTYPMLEAEYQGAAAILACSNEGFSEIATDAYNANDICGPISIPCTSITVDDAEYLKAKIEEGPVTANLKVDNIVEPDGVTYNIVGKIPGKNSDEMIVYGGHYDMYFDGFQDDNCAVGAVLSIAKAMVDSGYVPERDIVFVLHGAEEWGASYTQYDWTTGAWRMINEVHPEWAGKTLAFINFELPAYEFGSYTSVYSAPEMYSMITDFVSDEKTPQPVNCFADGVKTEGYQTYTYSDDFSYYVAGVPSTVNGFLLQEDMETVFPFYREIYHTNYDTKETYNEDVLRFTIEFYGAFGINIDNTPALELDYTAQAMRLVNALDEEVALGAEADFAEYKAAVDGYNIAAEEAFLQVKTLNAEYSERLSNGENQEALAPLWEKARALNKINLTLFKDTQDALLGLMYERPVVPHEAPQENISLMAECVTGLEAGNITDVVENTAWAINNINEWYAMYFSPEVIAMFDDMLWGESNQTNNNLFWGTNKAYTPADVEEATRSLTIKSALEGEQNFDTEIGIYTREIGKQQSVYKTLMAQETEAIKSFTTVLDQIDVSDVVTME